MNKNINRVLTYGSKVEIPYGVLEVRDELSLVKITVKPKNSVAISEITDKMSTYGEIFREEWNGIVGFDGEHMLEENSILFLVASGDSDALLFEFPTMVQLSIRFNGSTFAILEPMI